MHGSEEKFTDNKQQVIRRNSHKTTYRKQHNKRDGILMAINEIKKSNNQQLERTMLTTTNNRWLSSKVRGLKLRWSNGLRRESQKVDDEIVKGGKR